MIEIRVHGIPAPQGSKRHVGNGRMIEMSRAVGPWREAIRAETQRVMEAGAEQVTGAAYVKLLFRMPRPKGHYGKRGLLPSAPLSPAGAPDLDKLIRAALDAITAGGAIRDDAQIVAIAASKHYAAALAHPGLELCVRPAR